MNGGPVSHYRLIEPVGAGAMGQVYRAEDTRLGRPVALKIVRPGRGDGTPLAAVLAEARAASTLVHPNIAVIYEVDEARFDREPVGFIAMEYVEGRTLADRSLVEELDLDAILDLVRQAADALAAAHRRGIVHRDVKPANLMVTPARVLKVLDFGVARRMRPPLAPDDPTRESGQWPVAALVAGTLPYMAPEQIRGEPQDGRVDLFALGVVLYELIAGTRPFDRETPVRTLEAVLRDDPAPLPSRFTDPRLPAIEALIRRMLAKLASDRPPDLETVSRALEDLRRGITASPDAVREGTVLAVAPFANISGNPEDEWLGIGLAETLSADLAQIAGVTVVTRTRVHELLRMRKAEGTDLNAALVLDVARELGAEWVVGGIVQRSASRVRVTATIGGTEREEAIRTVRVDGSVDDIFRLQDALVREVSGMLAATTGRTAGVQHGTAIVEAYEAFSRGVLNLRVEGYESLDRAVLLFERAVALDPQYGRAHLELGAAYAAKADYLVMPELRERARTSLLRALQLLPDSVRAWRELGGVLLGMGQEAQGFSALERALQIDGNDAGALAAMGRALFIARARFEEAARWFERALALNPRAGWYALQLAHCAALLRDFARGERAARRAVALQEAFLSGQEGLLVVGGSVRLGHLAALQGRHGEAVDHFLRELDFLVQVDHALRNRIIVELNARLGAAYLALGQRRKAEAAFGIALEGFERRVRLGADEPFTRFYAAGVHALRGEAETALAYLERAAEARPAFTLARARIEPEFASLRDDPRFVRLLGSLEPSGPRDAARASGDRLA
ncbi:MAG TPA: protein kinase [Vicinamibacterales bacterium]